MEGEGDSQGGFFKRLAGMPESVGVEFHNRGMGGNTVKDMLERVEWVSELRPYDVIVLLGCNDLPRRDDASPQVRSSQEDYARQVRELLERVHGGGRALFVSSFEVSEARAGVAPEVFEAYMAEALRAARGLGYEIWDLHGETRGRTEPLLAADGLHFNDAGHTMIAERLTGWVQGRGE